MATIALVANDRNLVTSVSVTLEAEGYRIAAYTDGASALSGFQTAPPDLAILDIKMPRLDGAEALRLLRAKSDLPVIFLTSTEEVIDEVFALEMGADDFIRKPFSQRLLVERVKQELDRTGDATGFDCESHGKFKVANTVFKGGRVKNYIREQWEAALRKAKKRTKAAERPVIKSSDF